ncbi:MAG: hypothetical protein ACOC21_02005 [Halanaerobiales bacterium]
MNQVNQLQNSIRQVRQNLDSINTHLNQLNQLFGQSYQQLDNSWRLSNQIQQQFNNNFQTGIQTQYGQSAGVMGGSQYQTTPYSSSQYQRNYRPYQTSQSIAGSPGNLGGAQTQSINRRDRDVGSSYYNMKGTGSTYPVSQYQGQNTGGYTQSSNFVGSAYSGGQQPLYY